MHSNDSSIELLGVRVDCETYETLTEKVLSWVEERQKSYCCFTNPHSIILCQSDSEFRDATNAATLVLPDGVGVLYASRILGLTLKERVTGPASMLKIVEAGIERGLKHYFYGSSQETLDALCRNLQEKHPTIQIAGACSPPYRKLTHNEIQQHIININEANADILWIGLGAPKQEKWAQTHLPHLTPSVCMAVGAAFDYHADMVKWAPGIVRKLGLEWAYRLIQQPKRLLARNLNSFRFLWSVVKVRFAKRSKNE